MNKPQSRADGHVRAVQHELVGSCRRGTLITRSMVLQSIFGPPVRFDPPIDDKVATVWTIQTPRGLVNIRDYWWNVNGLEWSLACKDLRALRWLRRHLIEHGARFAMAREIGDRYPSQYIAENYPATTLQELMR